ncbi:hypothetical protein ACFWIA_20690 [Streptomyces sp. NPDC127068]|uniref:hypothetical protein n=1 Tax=Streptomyces sp. NPDC127068 TaxID=3347127 RepID=UPI00365DBF16
MAAHGPGGRSARRWRTSALLALMTGATLLAGPIGCGAPAAPAPLRVDEAQRVLDQRARAVLARDAAGYRATGDPGPGGAAPPDDPVFDRLARVPLDSWSYRVTGVDRSGDRAAVRADLAHRIEGYDRAPVVTARLLDLRLRGDRWYVAGDRPAAGAPRHLWEQGPVEAVRGKRSLVLGTGQDRARLQEFAALADRAVPGVSAEWGEDWAGRVLVLVPGSLDGMGALLGQPAAGYRGIAAVTTGEVGGRGPADRIVVNPRAYGALGAFGQRVVLTHETVHVATRAHTSAATPLWLSEGYADWVGYRAAPGSGTRTDRQRAPELERAVRDGRVPERLPRDADFGFARDPARLARAYEGGWLACRLIEEQWGAAELNAFYRAVGAGTDRAGAVEDALREVLGVSEAQFTARWREHLTRTLG